MITSGVTVKLTKESIGRRDLTVKITKGTLIAKLKQLAALGEGRSDIRGGIRWKFKASN